MKAMNSLQWIKNAGTQNNNDFKRTYSDKKTSLNRLPVTGKAMQAHCGSEGYTRL